MAATQAQLDQIAALQAQIAMLMAALGPLAPVAVAAAAAPAVPSSGAPAGTPVVVAAPVTPPSAPAPGPVPDESDLHFLAQLVAATNSNPAAALLEQRVGAAQSNVLFNQAGPGNAAGSFYEPQQLKIIDLMVNGSPASVPPSFLMPGHPPYTVDQATTIVAKWAKQGEATTASKGWIIAFAGFLARYQAGQI